MNAAKKVGGIRRNILAWVLDLMADIVVREADNKMNPRGLGRYNYDFRF